MRIRLLVLALMGLLIGASSVFAQAAGSIRGVVFDKDFDVPLAAANVTLAETGETVTAADEGNYVFPEVKPGAYTLIFSKDGYARQVKSNVVVSGGQLTEVSGALYGEFEEMAEFVVQDIQMDAGTEAGLLMLKIDSPALLDAISSELMSQAGVSDAADALKLVAGATVQDGKFAVVRGLPDRYVNSQMNGVRLPTADADKRAVELDQFPAAIIDSVQVSKTFTPDQQGDASGGAVNIVLKGIPEENIFSVKVGTKYNTQASGNKDFVSYDEGGVSFWGKDDGGRDIPADGDGDGEPDFRGPYGTSRKEPPWPYDFEATLGGKHIFDNELVVGGLLNFFYKSSLSHTSGVNDKYWLGTNIKNAQEVGDSLIPTASGTEQEGTTDLNDFIKSKEELQIGGLGAFGLEWQDQQLNALFLQTRTTSDTATINEDTRGKQFFFPGHDPYDFSTPGHGANGEERGINPYSRTETYEYQERVTETLQFSGEHRIPLFDFAIDNMFTLLDPELDWSYSINSAESDKPNKTLFAEVWLPGFPGFSDLVPARHFPDKAGNFNTGNVQKIWENIIEESDQYQVNFKLPFNLWNEEESYVKVGVFRDDVERNFTQESYTNAGQPESAWPDLPPPLGVGPEGDSPFEDFFSDDFENWPAASPLVGDADSAENIDIDYRGEQEIEAFYYMNDMALTSWFNVIWGVRYESTKIGIQNFPETDAVAQFPDPVGLSGFFLGGERIIDPETGLPLGDVLFEQDDILPSYGFVLSPLDQWTLRGTYSETVARQTFKELSLVARQEYAGGDFFVGNPDLQMAALENYDLRLEFKPFDTSLFSMSWFRKDIEDTIELIQLGSPLYDRYETPVNFPKGQMEGIELEMRQDLGYLWDPLEGLSVGANATFIDSTVKVSDGQIADFEAALGDGITITEREMVNAPKSLINYYITYDYEKTGTKIGLFYTINGEKLVVGPGVDDNNFVPGIYAEEYDTLNLSITQKLTEDLSLKFQAKNLTDPLITEVYRSEFIADKVVHDQYKRGQTYSVSLTGKW
jgi:TonB-dependent receptor